MSQTWYIKHNGKVLGPVDAAKLKQLATTGQIKAATEVRLGDAGEWIPASNVKGLIAREKAQQKPPSAQHVASTNFKADQPEAITRAQAEPINPYQSPAFDQDERPTPPTAETQGLKTTRTGLFTVYYGICAVLLAIGGGFLLGVLGAWMGASIGVGMGVMAAFLLAAVAFIGGYIAIFVGQILCLSVPRASGGKGYVQVAVAMQALSILLAVGGGIIMAVMETSGSIDPVLTEIGSSALNFFNSILGFVGYLCFLLFLKNLALFIGRQDLAISSSTVMKMVIACAVMPLVIGLIAVVGVFAGGLGFLVVGVFGLAFLLLLLITFIRYANLVGYLARAIPN